MKTGTAVCDYRGVARRKRLQFPGAVYHVMSRGNRKAVIFENDDDRLQFLTTVDNAAERYRIRVYEFCLMGTHYHLLLETPRGNLSDAMRYINGVFSQSSNWRHGRVGHVLQGRFRSIVVPWELYLRRVSRYIVINPVAAGLVPDPAEWPWSSYRASAGIEAPRPFLESSWIQWAFGVTARSEAQLAYREYVLEAVQAPSPDAASDDVMKELAEAQYRDRPVPQIRHQNVRPSLEALLLGNDGTADDRKLRIYQAHTTYGYRFTEIAHALKVHKSTPGIIVRRLRASGGLPDAPEK